MTISLYYYHAALKISVITSLYFFDSVTTDDDTETCLIKYECGTFNTH